MVCSLRLSPDTAVGTVGPNKVSTQKLYARLQSDEYASIGLFFIRGEGILHEFTAYVLVLLQEGEVEVFPVYNSQLFGGLEIAYRLGAYHQL